MSTTFEFACTKEGETDAAIKVTDHASGEQIWIPFSQVESMHFNDRGEGTMVVSEWIAKKKGLV